jgi:hypothetical protein
MTAPRRRSAAALGVAALLALGACTPPPPRTAIPVASPLAGRELPLGRWRVVGHHAAGVSALSPREADAWIGREAVYTRATAGFAPDTCLGPRYITSTISLSELAAGFRVRPEDLQIAAANVQVIDVRCGSGWSAPGNRLVVITPNRLVTFWDGMMFELARE